MEKLVLKSEKGSGYRSGYRSALRTAAGLALAFALGCGSGDEQQPEETVDSWTRLNGQVEKTSTGGLQGTGSVRFSRTADNRNSSLAIFIKGELPSNSSSVEIVLLSSRELDVLDGLHISLTRSGNTLYGSINNNLTGVRTINPAIIGALSADSFAIAIDIHMFATTPRVLMYPFAQAKKGNYFFDSNRAGDLNGGLGASAAPGIFNGAILNNAKINSVFITDPVTPKTELP